MSTTVTTCWLKDSNGDKIAPKTIASQVQMRDGTTIEDKIKQTIITETDPTVPAWAKEPTKPKYTASEVGALPNTTIIPTVPTKVSAFENDKGYLTEHQSLAGYAKETYVDNKIAAIPTPDVSGQINTHNTSTVSHNDIRLLIEGLTTRLNTLANSDDTTLDQMSEIVAYIKNNKSLIEGVTTNKVNVADIINNLTTNVANKPLSAAQGVALKALIDAIVVPTKVSELTNDKGYITNAPVTSVNGKTGDVTVEVVDEIYVGDGDMPADATIQILLDGADAEATEEITEGFVEGKRLSTTDGTLKDLDGAIATPLIDISKYGDRFTINLGVKNGGSTSSVMWYFSSQKDGNAFAIFNDDGSTYCGFIGITARNGVTYNVRSTCDVEVIVDKTKADKPFSNMRFSASKGTANLVSVTVTYQKHYTLKDELKDYIDEELVSAKTEIVNAVIAALPKYNGGVS